MCLGVPGKITETWPAEGTGMRMGRVDFGGVAREACLALVPDADVGDYVLIHVGFAITQLDEDEAHRTLELLSQMGVLGGELGRPAGERP